MGSKSVITTCRSYSLNLASRSDSSDSSEKKNERLYCEGYGHNRVCQNIAVNKKFSLKGLRKNLMLPASSESLSSKSTEDYVKSTAKTLSVQFPEDSMASREKFIKGLTQLGTCGDECKKKCRKQKYPVKDVVKKLVRGEVDGGTKSPKSTEDVWEVFDEDNPMNLDLQGRDFWMTCVNDEQYVQDRKEYHWQHVHMKQKAIADEINKISPDKGRRIKMANPKVFDINEPFDRRRESIENQNKGKIPAEFREQLGDAVSCTPAPEKDSKMLAQIYRTWDKEKNKMKIENKCTRRVGQYYNLWERRMAKEMQIQKDKKEREKYERENRVLQLGNDDFEDTAGHGYDECLKRFNQLPSEKRTKNYPHTLRETKILQKRLDKSRRVLRDKAQIKSKYYESVGLRRTFPEADIEVPVIDKEEVSSLSEQSSDDEDDLYVGKINPQLYQLRGFQYKLGSEPRGKTDIMPKSKSERAPRTCMTRSEWCMSVLAKTSTQPFNKYTASTVKKITMPDDPNFDLFEPPRFRPKIKPVEVAPIKDHLKNVKPPKQKNIKFKKPKYFKVRRFNLTLYLYGTKKRDDIKTNMGKKFRKLYKSRKLQPEPLEITEDYNDNESEISEWVPEKVDPSVVKAYHPRRSKTGTLEDFYKEYSSTSSLESRAPYDIPRTEIIPQINKKPANLDVPKTPYTKAFHTRHHHQHNDPSIHRNMLVKYSRKIPNVRPCRETVPKLITKKELEPNELNSDTPVDVKIPHSRTAYEDYLPGKDKYLELIKNMATEVKRDLGIIKESQEMCAVNEDEYVEELKKEIESINSCLSSIESSICTNFTDDSGSILMVQNEKVPYQYLTKSSVPFQELNRIRVRSCPIPSKDDYYNPYRMVPFSGQLIEQKNMTKPKDKFFTFNQRFQAGVRGRTQVAEPNHMEEAIGANGFKEKGVTNVDYPIFDAPTVKSFKRKSTILSLRDGMRSHFECLFIQQRITEEQIAEVIQSEYADDIIQLKNMCVLLFQKWRDQKYHCAMKVLELIKPYYLKTDRLKNVLKDLETRMTKLNQRIVFTEDNWKRRAVLQNFHYMIMDQAWREKNDHIHLNDDGSLQNYRESIVQRKNMHLREGESADAWAIKKYYDTTYLPNKKPIEIVFPDAKTFLEGVNDLKTKTFTSLFKAHSSMKIVANLQYQYNQFIKESEDIVKESTTFVKQKCANKYFMEDRAANLEQMTRALLKEPLYDSIASPRLRIANALCNVLYLRIIPQKIRHNVEEGSSVINKLEMIFAVLIDLLGILDKVPLKKRTEEEKKYRKKVRYMKRQSQQAYLIERRIQIETEKIKKNLMPPIKLKREGKLPRVIFRKPPPPKPPGKPPLPEKYKIFVRAFLDDNDDETQIESVENQEMLTAIQDSCIPFHFDHYLRLHGYEPNYNFKTQIELSEGPEERLFKYDDVLPDVFKGLENWNVMKKNQIEADIQKTLYLYLE